MTSPITPKDAQSWLDARDSDRRMDRQEAAALMEVMAEDMARTLAAMRVEHDHGVVDWEQVDGRYETRHRVRLVSEWRDAGQ